MFRTIVHRVAPVRIAALFAACVVTAATTTAWADPFAPDPDMRLVIKRADPRVALDSSGKVSALLDDLGAPSGANLRARINGLLNAPFMQKLQGLGGIQARSAAETAEVTLDTPGSYEGPIQSFSVTGQIKEEVNGQPGFYYEPGEPMHMWVEMITTATRTPTVGVEITKRWAQMFRVEVPANAVTVEYKSGTGNNVFPGFAAAAFPIDSAMASGFNWKLWAVGNAVRVTDYWVDRNIPPGDDPSYPRGQQYTADNVPARLASIFATDPDACIDVMFALNPALDDDDGGALDNGELPATADPPYYCLGRCKNPPIVNTR